MSLQVSTALPSPALRRVTAVLCLIEIISWGALYYAFPVLAPRIAADTGWSSSWVVAAFTLGQVVSALVGLAVGRLLHHRGPRALMSIGALVAVIALIGVGWSPNLPAFFAAWVVAGTAMAAVLYPPAFAAVTGWAGDDAARRVRALTALTLVAGLASTVFAPVTAFLADPLGWRTTYVVLAAVVAAAIPVAAWGLRDPWPEPVPSAAGEADRSLGSEEATGPVWRTRPFVQVVAALSLVGLCIWSVVILLVPLLTERGVSSQAAAVALGLGGVGQVSGRLGYARLSRNTSVRTRTRAVFAAVAATTLALALCTGPYVALALLSLLAGAARGVYTLVQATAISDRWGTGRYARLNAVASTPLLLTAAVAPWAATALAAAVGGQSRSLVLLAAVAAVAAVAVPADRPGRRPAIPK